MSKKHTVLVVEDEKPLLEAICAKLALKGFDSVAARDIDQAFGYLEDGIKIDAVWLDHYLLGQKTGLDFLATAREQEKFKSIPVFIVSNTASPDKQQAYLRLGAVKYFVKANTHLDSAIDEIREYIESAGD